MRTLALGSMPAGAKPRTHLASGPWCFTGRESLFPGWDGDLFADADTERESQTRQGADPAAFPMPDDPYPDARSMEAEARAANGETLRLIRLLGGEADKDSGHCRSEQYWQMALGPFLLPAVHMLAERQRRVANLLALYGDETLRVELLPEDLPFSFCSTLDFMLHGIQDVAFNHYVFSRIVEAALASGNRKELAWQTVYLPPVQLHQASRPPRQSYALRCRNSLRRLLRALPFPFLKGFSLRQTLLLSLAVISARGQCVDRSLNFSQYCSGGFSWSFPAEKLIRACLPLDLQNGMLPGKNRQSIAGGEYARKQFPLQGRLRGMSPTFSQDDAYRLYLANLLESGCRLFSVQHGANYGNLLSVGILPFEYSRHVFFSWGWRQHEGQPANAHPLPHPSLVAICGAHKEKFARLILVGTEMSAYTYRLKSRPLAKAMLAYRKRKIIFFRALLALLRKRTANGLSSHCAALRERAAPELLYRPYFKVAGGLEDADYVCRHLPEIALCTGDLNQQMLSCRLLVLDHYGTTLHMALAADVPTLAFWNRREWGMTPESELVLDALEEAGILHASPDKAAGKAAAVWDNPAVWWHSQPVRKARALWLERYAKVGDTPDRPWTGWELTRRWFTTLRAY